jgi:diguanylate cyclase (GGDEF)-like protein
MSGPFSARDLARRNELRLKMRVSRRTIFIEKMRRLFDAFDLSSGSDGTAPATAARAWVIESSNSFLGTFLNFWIVLSVMFAVIGWLRMPQAWYATTVMLLSGSAARYAVYRGRVLEARWIFLLPMTILILISPLLINGIRTPILANISLLIILYGWMIGRRAMAILSVITAVYLFGMSFAEEVGWWALEAPLREPDVWLRAFLLDIICCTVAVASLIGSYQAEMRRRFSLENRLTALNVELEALAFHDSLTGLANRRLFFDRLDQAMIRCRRRGSWGAVLLLDLNRFKELNDKFGHEAGDRLLVDFARRLQSAARAVDTVARLGGDEFVVLVEEIGSNLIEAQANALQLVAKLQQVLSEPYDLTGADFQGSASVGYTIFDALHDADAASILREADASMYEAKKRQAAED